jgi:hypothetical protein
MNISHRLRASLAAEPALTEMNRRASFRADAFVKLTDQSRYPEAREFTSGFSMVGLVRPRLLLRDDQAWFEFELEDDAVLFATMFGGSILRNRPAELPPYT